jgi:hyperosmotically inducible periplasmic protein
MFLPYRAGRRVSCVPLATGLLPLLVAMRHQPWIQLLVIATLAASPALICAQQNDRAAPSANAQPSDNTKTNRVDRRAGGPTADQAKNDRSDREIMQKIRKEIVTDKSLSTYAHNVKVIASHGKVTLKGPVHSDDERKAIEAKAASVVGPKNVTNDITVKNEAADAESQR